jgi:ribosome assembly protein 1
MPAVPINDLIALQEKTKNIRNISIVAHVDHGKTTLSDSLISSNGIFSARNAGKIRYMDFTKEEQERGITMKSASISLLFKNPMNEHFLINLIDSPGHVDFTTEVGSALRVTDGCIVVVDAVEGACIQTRVVIRQAWNERVRPVLFINKLDKLFSKLKLDEDAIYDHIKKLLTSVNEITSVLWSEEYMTRERENEETPKAETTIPNPYDFELEEDDGEYFSPSKGNVVFGSARDGWGFRTEDFTNIYAEKLSVRKDVLKKTLWGDFYYNPKTKVITNKKSSTGKNLSMFSMFVLNPIYRIFSAIADKDQTQIQKNYQKLKFRNSCSRT